MTALQKPKGTSKAQPAAARRQARSRAPLLEDVPVSELLSACRNLQGRWALDAEMIAGLLGTSRSTWFRWLESLGEDRPIPWTGDQRTRALALLRIFEAVADLHQEDRDADAWVHEPLEVPGFDGRPPLEVMAAGFEGLLAVRDYLDFLHSAWA